MFEFGFEIENSGVVLLNRRGSAFSAEPVVALQLVTANAARTHSCSFDLEMRLSLGKRHGSGQSGLDELAVGSGIQEMCLRLNGATADFGRRRVTDVAIVGVEAF